MTNAGVFRRTALGMNGAVERAHMGHPDFRANGRIFATLHTGELLGMVKLTPDQQQELIDAHPGVFSPEKGAWGRAGCTRVQLSLVDEEILGEAMTLAWQNSARPDRASTSARTRSARSAAPKRPRRRAAR